MIMNNFLANENIKDNYLHPVVSFFSKPLTNREKIALKKSYIVHLKEYVFSLRPPIKESYEVKCSILKPLYQRPGVMVMTAYDIIFFDDLKIQTQINMQTDNIFFFKHAKGEDSLLYKIIPLVDVKEIQTRRFLGKQSALEVFLMDDTTILFNFESA